jgi:hypothetical protein
LGGTSVTVQFCTIEDSLTGHNLKSRAHFTLVEHCLVSGAANREFDLVDSWDTRRPNSNAVLVGNVIIKMPGRHGGNHAVINFGQENGRHNGTIYVINNTIQTSYLTTIELSSPDASARFVNNLVEDLDQPHPRLADVSNGASLKSVLGAYNVLSPGFDISGTRLDTATLYTDTRETSYSGADRPLLLFVPGRAFYLDGAGTRHDVGTTYFHSKKKGWYKPASPAIGAGD